LRFLPVPPTLRFPTAITGKSKEHDLNPCIEKKFRILVIKPYKMALETVIFAVNSFHESRIFYFKVDLFIR
jgi:hypothetical protein